MAKRRVLSGVIFCVIFLLLLLLIIPASSQIQSGARSTTSRRPLPGRSRGTVRRSGTDMGIPGVMTSSRGTSIMRNTRPGMMQVRYILLSHPVCVLTLTAFIYLIQIIGNKSLLMDEV